MYCCILVCTFRSCFTTLLDLFLRTAHVGWVYTDMGDTIDRWVAAHMPQLVETKITVDVSAKGCIEVFTGAKLTDSAKFLAYDGTELPW